MSWPIGHVYSYDGKTNSLITTKIWHLKNAKRFANFKKITEETSFKLNVGLPGTVLKQKTPIWIEDVQKDGNFPRARKGLKIGIRGGFAMPILVRNKVFAVLEFFYPHSIKPDQDMSNTMSCIAMKLGRIIERKLNDQNLKLTKRLLKKDCVRSTKKLKEHEEHLVVCWQGSRDGAWDMNLKTNKVIYSDRWKAMLGYKPDEIGDSLDEWSSRVHPEDYPLTRKIANKHLEGKGPYKLEYRIKNRDGKWLWFQCNGQALWNKNGKPYRLARATAYQIPTLQT